MATWSGRVPTSRPPESKCSIPRIVNKEQYDRFVEAGELIHDKLERLPKKKARAYVAGFKQLIDLIERHKSKP